ncbi:MAG: flagellar biosynthetic protein FliO [Burkholderiales bacterium]
MSFLLLTGAAAAAETPPAPTVGMGSLLQMLAGLAIVLALVLSMGWLLKRLTGQAFSHNSAIRIIAGAAVGQRERVVVVEVADSWLVLGVAPGSINALHTMPRGELPVERPAAGVPPFPLWLRRVLEKKNAG